MLCAVMLPVLLSLYVYNLTTTTTISIVVVVVVYYLLPSKRVSLSRSHGSVRVVRTTSEVNGKC